jgi:hypothetical protein
MRLNKAGIKAYLLLILVNFGVINEVYGQKEAGFEEYLRKYPGNSLIITSLRQEMVIGMADGKPAMNLEESKEYLALNDNASFFADSRESFGAIYKFRDIEAYSLVPLNGEYKKIPVKSFNKTSEASNTFFYDDIITYNFTFPSVVKGTKMISRIKMSSDDPVFPYKTYFGDYFPCESYIFTVICPENVEINYRVFGRDTSNISFSIQKKGGKKIYTWNTSNTKSYARDEYAPGADYYMPHVIVQIGKFSYKGKTTIINNSVGDFYKIAYQRISNINLTESAAIKNLTDSITKDIKSAREKVRKIYSWVQKNIKYVAFEDGVNGFIPREASLVLRRKYGDCKDKTSLLVAMMKSQGLKASYTWVGTSDIPYKLSEFATDYCFNHMIAVWWDENNNPVILDGTTRYNSIEEIPSFIQGKECLIENGPNSYKVYTIPVSPPWKNIVYDSVTVELKGDTLVGTGLGIIFGEFRADILDYIEGKDPADLPQVINKLMPKASNKFIIKSVAPLTTSTSDTTFKFKYDFYLPGYLTVKQNVTYFNLNIDRFTSGINLKDDRWIPVELNSTRKHIFICTFKIPNGYGIRDIPKNSSFSNDLFGFNYSYEISKQEIKLKSVVILNFRVIEDNEMALFREMLGQLNTNYLKSIPIYKTSTP